MSRRWVYVGNIPYSVSKTELAHHMQKAGDVLHVTLLTSDSGCPRGKAIVEFTTDEAAERAIATLNKSLVEGRQIVVKEDDTFAQKKPATSKPAQLHFSNLPLSVTWQQLKDVCREIGPVVRSEIILDRSGTSRGQGHVLFERYEDAVQACSLLNGAVFNDRRVQAALEAKPLCSN